MSSDIYDFLECLAGYLDQPERGQLLDARDLQDAGIVAQAAHLWDEHAWGANLPEQTSAYWQEWIHDWCSDYNHGTSSEATEVLLRDLLTMIVEVRG
jgi:hypothetical protein